MITTDDALATLTKGEREELKKLIASLTEEQRVELKKLVVNLVTDAIIAAVDFTTDVVFRAAMARAAQAHAAHEDTPLIPAIGGAFQAGWLQGFDNGMQTMEAALKGRALQ
jgi:hypothetical protein